MTGIRRKGFTSHHFRSFGVIFGKADLAENAARLEFVILEIERADRELYGCELVVVVEDGEIVRKAGGGSFAAKQARA